MGSGVEFGVGDRVERTREKGRSAQRTNVSINQNEREAYEKSADCLPARLGFT
jgi:hypothetical protein